MASKDVGIDNNEKIITDDNDDSIYVIHQSDDKPDLKVGMLVYSEEEAFNLYNSYAINKGFSVRKGKVRRYEGTSDLRQRIFLCSCEGFKEDSPPFEDKKFDRMLTRTGCKARAVFNVENGVWELVKFTSEHNHTLAKPEQRHLLRSGRKITSTCAAVLSSMSKAGIRATKAYSYLSKEAGGVQNVGFTERDCHNFLQSEKSKSIEAGDAQSLINYFKCKQSENPMFFYTVQVDDQNRMSNFFWRDGSSKLDYECFGDVVIFDTTYRTNKYNMICAPFVGVNHHWKNVLFGCAFLLNETTASFVWLFEAFLEAMGNKAPKTIFTDQDGAMANAIRKVLPNTRHRLCTWHILKNAAQNISILFANSRFKEKFTKLFYGCETEEEFESMWGKINEEHDIAENKWLSKLYDLREKWCPAFSRDTFSANIRSTQRSESTNNIFQNIACKTMTLTEFVQHYDESASRMREIELNDDFSCSRGKPHIVIPNNGILIHAAQVYTHTIFRMFQDEFLKAVNEVIVRVDSVGTLLIYTLKAMGCHREHIVEFHYANFTAECSCKMFESLGFLCRHGLRVLNLNAIQKISSENILKRWTKGVKEGIISDEYGEPFKNATTSSKTIFLNKLMCKAFNVMSLSAYDEETVAVANEHLDQIVQEVRKIKSKNVMDSCDDTNGVHGSTDEKVVLDPPRMRPKGVTYGRLKGCLEKQKKKAKKGATKSRRENVSLVPASSQHMGSNSHTQIFGHHNNPFVSFQQMQSFLPNWSQVSYNNVIPVETNQKSSNFNQDIAK